MLPLEDITGVWPKLCAVNGVILNIILRSLNPALTPTGLLPKVILVSCIKVPYAVELDEYLPPPSREA